MEFERIFEKINQQASRIKTEKNIFSNLQKNEEGNVFILIIRDTKNVSLKLYWSEKYLDSLLESFLEISIWDNSIFLDPSQNMFNESKCLSRDRFYFSINLEQKKGWENEDIFLTSDQLSDKFFLETLRALNEK